MFEGLFRGSLTAVSSRHLFLPPPAITAIALWIILSHAHNAFRHSPRLTFCSPTEGSGKSTALKLLSRLCPEATLSSHFSEPALCRLTDQGLNTVLIDEFDTYNTADYVRIINSGHDREGAKHLRCELTSSGNWQHKEYRTWAPMAIAKIGSIEPASLRSRCIVIWMMRAKPNERPEPLTPDHDPVWGELRDRCKRWGRDNLVLLRNATPMMDGLSNRAADNWAPLFAIADLAGGDWPKKARDAALALTVAPKPSELEDLLAAIRRAFGTYEMLTAKALCDKLSQDEEFEGADGYAQLKDRAAGRKLNKALEGLFIKSGQWGDGKGGSQRGFRREQFEDPWKRYLKEP